MNTQLASMNAKLAGRYAPTDIIVGHAEGASIRTTGGARFIDFILGNLTQLRGFRSVVSLVRRIEELDLPLNVGDYPHEVQDRLAEKLLSISRKECLRYTNSGSEAIHLAVRVARAHTGRRKIVRFYGHYHGWYTEEIAGVVPVLYSEGLPDGARDNLIQLQWNDFDALREAFARHGDDIACIMCEPVLAHSGTITPKQGFLQAIVDLAQQNGSISIFDECITGFRVGLTDAQGLFGVYPDMVVYSKAVSGGVPFGVLLGKIEHFVPLSEWRVFHASTYDGNILSMLSCLEVIDELERGEIYDAIGKAQSELISGLEMLFTAARQPYHVQEAPGLFQIFFTEQNDIGNYSDAQATDIPRFSRFVHTMRKHGVRISEGDLSHANPHQNWLGSWFLSAAHNGEAVARTLEAAEASIQELSA